MGLLQSISSSLVSKSPKATFTGVELENGYHVWMPDEMVQNAQETVLVWTYYIGKLKGRLQNHREAKMPTEYARQCKHTWFTPGTHVSFQPTTVCYKLV